jgi:hypothetical protein
MQSAQPQCKRCGAKLAAVSRVAARASIPVAHRSPEPTERSANPYAPPSAGSYGTPLAAIGELFRDGNLLVVRDGAPFPDRCVRCNEPAEGYRLKRTYYWHPPGWYLLILASVLIYAIAAMVVRKKATFAVSLCQRHRSRRVHFVALGIGIPVLALAAWIATGNDAMGPILVIAILVGLVLAIVGTQLMTPKRIEDGYAYLKGAHPEFLARLPLVG